MLTAEERVKLYDAILSMFNRAELGMLLSFSFNVRLDVIDDGSTFAQTVLRVIEWAEAEGRTEDLIRAARDQRPQNQQFRATSDWLLERLSKRKLQTITLLPTTDESSRVEERKVRHFGQADLYKIRDLLLRLGFGRSERQSLLFVSMEPHLVAALPDQGAPDARLMAVLDRFNTIGAIEGDEIPFRTLLLNARENSNFTSESKELERFLALLQ